MSLYSEAPTARVNPKYDKPCIHHNLGSPRLPHRHLSTQRKLNGSVIGIARIHKRQPARVHVAPVIDRDASLSIEKYAHCVASQTGEK